MYSYSNPSQIPNVFDYPHPPRPLSTYSLRRCTRGTQTVQLMLTCGIDTFGASAHVTVVRAPIRAHHNTSDHGATTAQRLARVEWMGDGGREQDSVGENGCCARAP